VAHLVPIAGSMLLAALACWPCGEPRAAGSAGVVAEALEQRDYALVEGGLPVGLCRERRHERGGVLTLERVYEWPRAGAEPVVVRHVETRDSLGWRLSWRELAKDGGSLHAQRGLDGALEWRAHDAFGSTSGATRAEKARFPLEAGELARTGRLERGGFELFEPTTRRVSMVAAASRALRDERRFELVRSDGLVAHSWTWRAGVPQGFALQDGASEARLLAPRRVAALRDRLGLPALP
jgi:hypothetical protein